MAQSKCKSLASYIVAKRTNVIYGISLVRLFRAHNLLSQNRPSLPPPLLLIIIIRCAVVVNVMLFCCSLSAEMYPLEIIPQCLFPFVE